MSSLRRDNGVLDLYNGSLNGPQIHFLKKRKVLPGHINKAKELFEKHKVKDRDRAGANKPLR